MVPFLDLSRQHAAIRSMIDDAIGQVIDKNAYIGGEAVAHFEAEIGRFLRTVHAIAMANGTDALALALRVAGVLPGDEVVVPAFSFVASASVVTGLGAKPVFADVDLATFCMDPEAFREAITPRTKAVIPVHLYGHPAAMDEILKHARKRGIAVIEDACQAIGATYKGKPVGGIGDIGTLSFYPTKNLGGLGDGGMALAQDQVLADKLRLIRDHGQSQKYHHTSWGTNSRLDGIQAAALRVKLRRLEAWNKQRDALANRYVEGLSGLPLTLPKVAEGCTHVWHLYTIRVQNGRRDALKNHLQTRGIQSAVHYSTPLHKQPVFSYLSPGPQPRSERLASEVLSLPMFPELSFDEQDQVIAAIREFAF